MIVDETLMYFDSAYELCKKLKLKPQNIYKWKKQGWIPLKQQHRINDLLDKKLPIDIDKESLEERLKLMNRYL